MLLAVILAAAVAGDPAPCRDQTQMGLNACAASDAQAAERALNETYQALMRKLDREDGQRLRDAERAWVTWREKECLLRTGGGLSTGGSIAPMLVDGCNRDLARERTAFLRGLLQCGPGDLSCPAK